MCCWMGLHFHDWIDYNGVTVSQELLEWVSHFPDLRVKKIFVNLTCTSHVRILKMFEFILG